jgi:uncharacterized protein YjdB
MKNYLLFAVCFLTFVKVSNAQYNLPQNKSWVFGFHSGLSFNTSPPGGMITQINGGGGFLAGCASVSDASGSLLFYCSSDSVWTNSGSAMPNGWGLMPDQTTAGSYYSGFSSSQGSLIVPVIGSSSQYYVFSLQHSSDYTSGDLNAGRLFYCKVDMLLNGGLGDVVPGIKGIKIDSQLSEKMIAVPGNANDIWVLVHSLSSGVFKAFHVTSAGINTTPVVSTVGGLTYPKAYAKGNMKCSPDRTKLAMCNQDAAPGVQFATFNPATGSVSGLYSTSGSSKYPGGDFSPDNTKFYAIHKAVNDVNQFNLAAGSPSAVILSETTIGSNLNIFSPDMRLGPDGRIYVPVDDTHLDYIKFPNLLGSACGYTGGASVIYLVGSIKFSFGNMYVAPITPVSPITGTAIACVGTTVVLSDATPSGTWSSSNTSVATVGLSTGIVLGVSAGTATITYNAGSPGLATLTVTINGAPSAIAGSSLACIGGSISLTCSSSGGVWSSGAPSIANVSSSGLVAALATGTAIISYTISGCSSTKTVTVSVGSLAIAGSNTTCVGTTLHLSCTSGGGVWTSSNAAVATVNVSSGLVTGISVGTAIITYELSSGCSGTKVVSVSASSGTVAPIAGVFNLCPGRSTTLTNTTPGGIWTSSNVSIATISPSSGLLTGVSAGVCIVTYTALLACGTANSIRIITVLAPHLCISDVKEIAAKPIVENIQIQPNPNNGTFTINIVSDKDEMVTVKIRDINSRLVSEYYYDTNKMALVNLALPAGIYFLSATSAHINLIDKFIVR